MTPCSPQCTCCQKRAVHIHSLKQEALKELNFYRKLLQLDPLTTMDAFDSSTDNADIQRASRLRSTTHSAALETMPPEILDRIVQFVAADSILPLCHSFPYCKYISTAMFDFAHRFPNEHYTPYKLWPDMCFPIVTNIYSKTTEFPIQHLHAAGVYSRIVSKHGGNVNVPCSKNVLTYLGAFPDVLSVHSGGDFSGSGWAEFLRGLTDTNKRIRSCTFEVKSEYSCWVEAAHQLTRLEIQSLVWDTEYILPEEIQEALPFIPGLAYLELNIATDICENILSRCLTLKEISFTQLLLEDSEDPVGCILRRIEGSRIQKVWCTGLSTQGFRWDPEGLETLSSDFLKNGWHKEIHGDDEKVCFVHRHA